MERFNQAIEERFIEYRVLKDMDLYGEIDIKKIFLKMNKGCFLKRNYLKGFQNLF